MDEQNYPAAWYPDKAAPGQERWYDGEKWTGATRDAPAPAPEAKPLATGINWLLWFVVGLPALLFGGCIVAVMSNIGSDDVNEPSEGGARFACEDFVEDRLKSPGTADFQRPAVTPSGVNEWMVSGSVDAENSFGALVRTDYQCEVRGSDDGTWTLIDLSVQ